MRVPFDPPGLAHGRREALRGQRRAAERVAPETLTLEITESVFERHSDRLRAQLEALHAIGVRLSLDDFGTGYSSLLYLQQYPFDEIKVDKGVVQRMPGDPYSHQVVATVIGVAGTLGADAVAEGVEGPGERDALPAMGGRVAQGGHDSRPRAEADFSWLLDTRNRLQPTGASCQAAPGLKRARTHGGARLIKRATGIDGLDAATDGGLPAAGTTLVMGAPGAGKTVLGQQIPADAAAQGGGGVLASFEEPPDQLRANAGAFTWGGRIADTGHVALQDARPRRDADQSGRFDPKGLIAVLDAQPDRLGAARVVLDGADQLLRFAPDEATAVNEVQRLDDWARAEGVSLLVTAKRTTAADRTAARLAGIEFMLSTIPVLAADLAGRRLNRRFRILEYRGTGHVTDELPLVMDSRGVNLPSATAFTTVAGARADDARVSTGVPRLDRLPDGGYYRGASVLVVGAPGTSKTTLAAAFAQATATRGGEAPFVPFDEPEKHIVRNARSVGLDLQPGVDAGTLRLVARSPRSAVVEEHFMAVLAALDGEAPDVPIVDPVSGLLEGASGESPFPMVERLLGIAKARGVTTLMTSPTEREAGDAEAGMSHVSTIADTWISLDYRAEGGERNRALSIVKSWGTAHADQVRELVLSGAGVDLADVYAYGSGVLMGTARVRKEREVAQARRRERLERERRRSELDRRLKQAEARFAEAESEKQRVRGELDPARPTQDDAEAISGRLGREVRRRRDAGPAGRDGGRRPVDAFRHGRRAALTPGAREPGARAPGRDGGDTTRVSEVDLLSAPQEALDEGIFASPALTITTVDGDVSLMYGDLSDAGRVARFLGLE